MATNRNIELIRRCYEAFGRRDIATVLAGVATRVDWEAVVGIGTRLPFGGRRRSLDEVRDFFSSLDESLRFDLFTPSELLSDGDRVVARGRSVGIVAQTGRKIETEWVHLFRLQNEQIVHFREFTDTAAILDAFGIGSALGAVAETRLRPGADSSH